MYSLAARLQQQHGPPDAGTSRNADPGVGGSLTYHVPIPPARIRRLTPTNALGLLPYTTGLAASVCVALVTAKTWRQPSFPYARTVTALATGALIIALLLHASLRTRAARIPEWIDAEGATSWLLGLQLGVLLLTIPVLTLVTNIAADQEQWTWPFLNKRWLVALYFLAVATFLVFPIAFQWWGTWRSSRPGALLRRY